jgi:hypothetical protein
MERVSGHSRKVIEEDQQLYERESVQRARLRALMGVVLLLLALALVFAAITPLIVKENLPGLWVASANAYGWSKYLEQIGRNLLADGRIELFPMWISYVVLGLAGIVAWFGAQLIRNRHEIRLMGEVFTKGYWQYFYWHKKPESAISVTYQQVKKRP